MWNIYTAPLPPKQGSVTILEDGWRDLRVRERDKNMKAVFAIMCLIRHYIAIGRLGIMGHSVVDVGEKEKVMGNVDVGPLDVSK